MGKQSRARVLADHQAMAVARNIRVSPRKLNLVAQQIRGCDVLMIESNHDLEMLRIGPYPWSVKQRVMSRLGHLSNDALADFIRNEYDGGATFVVLAHLSEHNNHPEIARTAAERALSDRRSLLQNRLMLASQLEPMEPLRF